VPGWQPQHQAAGVADEPARDGDQPPPQGGDHGLAAAHPVPVNDVLAGGEAGELVQQAAMVAASSAPHIQARFTWGYPDGRCRSAADNLGREGSPRKHVRRALP
jgi:hypothetical protein